MVGINKIPVPQIEVDNPADRAVGGAPGAAGDFVGDTRHHGGMEQALYSFAREDLDRWEPRLGRELRDGIFGENLTLSGLDPNEALVGEVWRIGAAELKVTAPRIPCRTFADWLQRQGWVKEFTQQGRPGAYLRVLRPGVIAAGAEIEVAYRPPHPVTISSLFRALMTEKARLPRLREAILAAGEALPTAMR